MPAAANPVIDSALREALLSVPSVRLAPPDDPVQPDDPAEPDHPAHEASGEARAAYAGRVSGGEELLGAVRADDGVWEFIPNRAGRALGLARACCASPEGAEQHLSYQMERLGIAHFGSREQALAARAAAVTGEEAGFFAESAFGAWDVYCYDRPRSVEKCGTIVLNAGAGAESPEDGAKACRCRFMPTEEGRAMGFGRLDRHVPVGPGEKPSAALGRFFDRVVSGGPEASGEAAPGPAPGL